MQKQLSARSISYSHCKYRYELEIPEEIVKGNKKPAEFEFTSKRAGFERFRTDHIKKLVEKLEEVEVKLKSE